MTGSSFDIAALTAGITELRVAAETVRTAGIGLRCPDLSLFAITEQLWLFSRPIGTSSDPLDMLTWANR